MQMFTPNRLLRFLIMVCALILSAQPTRAAIACPMMIYDGNANQEELNLRFMNTAKVPIRQIEFYCTPLDGHSKQRTLCGVESGIFYPGTPYSARFNYPSTRARIILVSLRSVQFSEGNMWMSGHDQACRSLRIHAKVK